MRSRRELSRDSTCAAATNDDLAPLADQRLEAEMSWERRPGPAGTGCAEDVQTPMANARGRTLPEIPAVAFLDRTEQQEIYRKTNVRTVHRRPSAATCWGGVPNGVSRRLVCRIAISNNQLWIHSIPRRSTISPRSLISRRFSPEQWRAPASLRRESAVRATARRPMGGFGPPVRRSAPTANFLSLLARAPEQFCQVSPVSRRTQLGAR